MAMTESRTDSVLGLLGLARRAGAIAPGTDAVRRAVREGEACLVLFATDASGVQLDKIRTTMRDRAIPQVTLGDRDTLGAAVGLAPLSAVAVTDRALAERLVVEIDRSLGEGSMDAVEA
jgi:ribosomal protein L7Ae-like RNA K-turn-binding protein